MSLFAAESAPQSPDITVDFQQVSGAGAIVEPVHVLRDEGEVGCTFFEIG